MNRMRIGYVPLTDAAVLIAAAKKGFAEAQGIEIDLVREVSWANIRDKLILGHFDAAHMLAPFAIATSLGLGHVRVPLVAPFALNLNGNAITVSIDLYHEMTAQFGRALGGPAEAARGLAAVIAERRNAGRELIAFGMVFPFSTHTYLLRHWLRLGGIDLDRDVQLVVVPPPYMAESLRKGLVHGFCVGSPWNSMAVDAEVGRIVALGVDIARRAPEKILALPAESAKRDPAQTDALIRALREAAHWSEDKDNHPELARLLAAPDCLSLPETIIRETLDGDLRVAADGPLRTHPDFIVLGRATTNLPDPRHAQWLYAEMVHARQTVFSGEAYRAAAEIYRPDLYRRATGETAPALPGDPVELSAGPRFSAADPIAYLNALA